MNTPDVLAWRDGYIEVLDQTALPHQVRALRITTSDQLVDAITTLAVRGAAVRGRAGLEHRLGCDGAAPFLSDQGLADVVVVGADRVAANGDVANKVGAYSLALAARAAGIPFLVAAPESTLDPSTPSGAAIPIEQRADEEVAGLAAPPGTRPLNFASDITPAERASAVLTEERLILRSLLFAGP